MKRSLSEEVLVLFIYCLLENQPEGYYTASGFESLDEVNSYITYLTIENVTPEDMAKKYLLSVTVHNGETRYV